MYLNVEAIHELPPHGRKKADDSCGLRIKVGLLSPDPPTF
jgi:hypothetical protein